MTESAAQPEAWSCSYDLFLLPGGKRFYFRNTDRGVTLTDWRLDWNAGGKADGAPLENIAQVRLQCGGDWKNPLNQCQITFRDGNDFGSPHDPARKPLLTITDGNEYGTADSARTPVYRDFVRALHARLALAPPGTITFIRGYEETKHSVVAAAAFLLGLIGVAGPLVLLLIVQKMEVLFVLIGGCALCWPLYNMVKNNAPRAYDPKQLPEELME